MTSYKIAIVGAGPGGMSAAAHAAELGVSHVLLEKTATHANTIQCYQKGKFVMSEPNGLPLRSPLSFQAGSREEILSNWESGLRKNGVNARFEAPVTALEGRQGAFELSVQGGESVEAENVVLGIGVQGNPRKLGVPGEDLPLVQYTLDDPDEYKGEAIVVVGAGDAAIENSVALARQNTVYIINRRDEFARAKEANNTLILRSIDEGRIECFYKSNPARVEQTEGGERPYVLVLTTEQGEAEIPCDRIIARLGATPQRQFVESFGVRFTSDKPGALPELNEQLESNVPGLYVVGALAGNPLIKHAMNQGYEVVEHILGNPIEPVEYDALGEKFSVLPFEIPVGDTLRLMQERVPMFGEITPLLFREFMFDSELKTYRTGEEIYERGKYTNRFFTVLTGHVKRRLQDGGVHRIDAGQVFGEQELISGRPQNETVVAGEECILVETPRRLMIKLINSNESISKGVDELFARRAIQTSFTPNTAEKELRDVARDLAIKTYKPNEWIYHQGDDGNGLQLVRTGKVKLSRKHAEKDIVLAYVPAGNYFGEMGIMGGKYLDSACAVAHTEIISIDAGVLAYFLEKEPRLKEKIQKDLEKRSREQTKFTEDEEHGFTFLMQEGGQEANDILVIDESLCIGCDNCEKACAETHGGTSRLKREAGEARGAIRVPISCRHCEHPSCMKDCPPDAIRRSAGGQVFINDNCIGCGRCVDNCGYDAIKLEQAPSQKPNLMSWLLFGAGPGPGQHEVSKPDPKTKQKKPKEGKFESGSDGVSTNRDDGSGDDSNSIEKQGLPTGLFADNRLDHSGEPASAPDPGTSPVTAGPDTEKEKTSLPTQKDKPKAVKCDMCKDLSGGPACVRACPTGAALRFAPDELREVLRERKSG